jgi:hypothetical protein
LTQRGAEISQPITCSSSMKYGTCRYWHKEVQK